MEKSGARSFFGAIQQKIQSVSPVRFFVVTALVFGVVFALATPPFQTPDEPVHFYRAYQISTFDFVINGQGGELPKSLGDTVAYTTTSPDISFAANRKYMGAKTIRELSADQNNSVKAQYDFVATAAYPPISYIPQSIGIFMARVLGLSPILMMYAGRLANLAAWIVLFALAIKMMPRRKWALVFVGLLPMAIFQAVSMGADVMVIGVTALFLAMLLNLAEKKRVSNKQLLVLLLVAATLALSKQIMVVFLPLILLLPNKVFSSKNRAYLFKAGLILLPLLLFALWTLISKNTTIIGAAANHQDPAAQIKFALTSPWSFVNVLWNTYFFSWGDGVTRSFIGTFGWADAPLSELLATLGYIALFVVFVANTGAEDIKKWLSTKQKLIIGFCILAYWGAASAALYAYYSPVGFKIIVGLQGRYFLPLALLAIPLMTSKWLRASKTGYRNVAVLAPIFLLLVSFITLYVRYYINNV
jgi:uncharacterized membrane protein